MNRVLVVGGAGYIGSHAVKALVTAGQEVVVYDNLSVGHREAALRAGCQPASFVEGDIQNTQRLIETMRTHGVDSVMHFAASAEVGESVRFPSKYYRNNVTGSLSLLEAMASASVKHLVFSSTCAVFGNPRTTPIPEDHPNHPVNAYGETKLAIERALPHYARAYGLTSICLRYFNAAGADPDGVLGEHHDPESHVIPKAIDAALGRGAFQIFGEDYDTPDGTCLRDYIHVSDLAAAHLAALRALRGGAASTVYNLGNGRATSVRAVVEAVERLTGRKVPYTVGPRREGDPAVLFAASDRIRCELGWSPHYEDIDVIVDTAWRWRHRHPRGYTAEVNG